MVILIYLSIAEIQQIMHIGSLIPSKLFYTCFLGKQTKQNNNNKDVFSYSFIGEWDLFSRKQSNTRLKAEVNNLIMWMHMGEWNFKGTYFEDSIVWY